MIKQLREKISDLDQQKAALEAEIASIYADCLERITSHIQVALGLDVKGLVDRVSKGCDYIDASTLGQILFGAACFDATTEDWEQKTKELVDAGLIKVTHWFYDSYNRHGDMELSEADYQEVINPSDGQYFDPIYGEECSKQTVEQNLYDTYSTTEKYAELVKPYFDEVEM